MARISDLFFQVKLWEEFCFIASLYKRIHKDVGSSESVSQSIGQINQICPEHSC